MAVSAVLPSITISIVSHGQAHLASLVLNDLNKVCSDRIEVVLTLNIKEPLPFRLSDFSFPIKVIDNESPKGFGANHNQAYASARGDYFCVLNPDIRIKEDPFPSLLRCLTDHNLAVVAPKITDADGKVEDSARRFPTPLSILKKALRKGVVGSDYSLESDIVYPDWVGGMFMLFRSDLFAQAKGFNENFFLYYEDVELCARLWLKRSRVGLCTEATVVHDARRQSHYDFKYLKWHLASMTKFFLSAVFIRSLWLKR